MDPYASNIGFVLMECDQEPMERVMVLLQEKPIKLPKCDDIACDWQLFKDVYAVFMSYLTTYSKVPNNVPVWEKIHQTFSNFDIWKA